MSLSNLRPFASALEQGCLILDHTTALLHSTETANRLYEYGLKLQPCATPANANFLSRTLHFQHIKSAEM